VNLTESIASQIEASQQVKREIGADTALVARIAEVAQRCAQVLDGGGKILLAGNGGSAADSQHIAAELVGRFKLERRPLPAIALTTDTSLLTAVGNDYGFEAVFSRQIRGLGRSGDLFVGISTSGNSPNVLQALEACREMGLTTVGLTGAAGGAMADLCDLLLAVPSLDTPRIQESHIMIGHILCQLVDDILFGAT
jgi:D-sedoheptulose 7-phosphate isomerase